MGRAFDHAGLMPPGHWARRCIPCLTATSQDVQNSSSKVPKVVATALCRHAAGLGTSCRRLDKARRLKHKFRPLTHVSDKIITRPNLYETSVQILAVASELPNAVARPDCRRRKQVFAHPRNRRLG